MENKLTKVSPEFELSIKAFKEDMYRLYKQIANEPTPLQDSEGRAIVKKRPDGYDYVIAAYMEDMMHKHFPGWYREMAAPLTISTEWITAQVHVVFIDWGLYARGVPVELCKRKFYATSSARVQYKNCSCTKKNMGYPNPDCLICKGDNLPHIIENIVDLSNQDGAAVTKATKRGIEAGTGISSDIYKKRLDFFDEEVIQTTTE